MHLESVGVHPAPKTKHYLLLVRYVTPHSDEVRRGFDLKKENKYTFLEMRGRHNPTSGDEVDDEFLIIPEVAALLRITERTAYSLAREGGIPAVKVGRNWPYYAPP